MQLLFVFFSRLEEKHEEKEREKTEEILFGLKMICLIRKSFSVLLLRNKCALNKQYISMILMCIIKLGSTKQNFKYGLGNAQIALTER